MTPQELTPSTADELAPFARRELPTGDAGLRELPASELREMGRRMVRDVESFLTDAMSRGDTFTRERAGVEPC
jgi:hypothetical protein